MVVMPPGTLLKLMYFQVDFMAKSVASLMPGGCVIDLVPAPPRIGGSRMILLDIAVAIHASPLASLLTDSGWRLRHDGGLTYPISNLLLPLTF
ncbi:MAG: hypothetical protein NTX45_13580 [Proteobacteria bacterium]|nr:hypothetical protein [Pseudomonadota bacterium]